MLHVVFPCTVGDEGVLLTGVLGRNSCAMMVSCSSSRPRIPHSAYYFGAPPPDSAYGTDPCGQIGVHHPREVVRIERDYSGGELPQFTPTYPLELEGRVSALSLIQRLWSHAAGTGKPSAPDLCAREMAP